MISKENFDQQDVVALRPEDLIMVEQGGRPKRLKIGAVLDYLTNLAASNLAIMQGYIPGAISAFTNDVSYITAAALSPYAVTTAVTAAIAAALAPYATTAALNIVAAAIPTFWKGSAQRAQAAVYANTINTITGGTVTFPLVDGSGNTLFPNNVDFMKAEVSDAANSYNYAYALAGDHKSVVVTVMRSSATLLSLLGVNVLSAPAAAPAGVAVSLLVVGN